jgi:hypothetical protein
MSPLFPSKSQQERIKKLCSSRDVEGWIGVLAFVMQIPKSEITKEHIWSFIKGEDIVTLLGYQTPDEKKECSEINQKLDSIERDGGLKTEREVPTRQAMEGQRPEEPSEFFGFLGNISGMGWLVILFVGFIFIGPVMCSNGQKKDESLRHAEYVLEKAKKEQEQRYWDAR